MAHAQGTVTVHRPIEDVFAYLADGTNNRRWRAGVVEIERMSGDGSVGTTYHQVLQGPAGRKIEGDYRVTEYEEPRVLAFEVVAGPVRPTGRYEMESAGAGDTTLTFTLDAEPKGIMRLMSGMVKKQMDAEVGQLNKLAQDLESGGSGVAAGA